jgi:putative ABC transport system permease protein
MTTPTGSNSALGSLFSSFAVLWVKWRSDLVLALRSLWLHKLRAMLSVLGIVIGTAAVIALMAFGKGSMEDALEDIRRQGTTNVILRSVKPTDDTSNTSGRRSWIAKYGLTWDDYDRCSPEMLSTVVGRVPMRIIPQEVKYFGRIVQVTVVATTEAYAKIHRFEMAAGRFLVDGEDQRDEGDAQRYRNVIVLGSAVAEDLFPFESPIGKSVVLNKHQYKVVGVIKERVQGAGTGGQRKDFNRDVYIPMETCKVRFGSRVFIVQGSNRSAEEVQLHQITLTINDISNVRSTGDVVTELMKRYHVKKEWQVEIPLDQLLVAERARDRYNMLLAIIASISLLVGGIGIMNIMLATVTERTREIGIRRALGAKRRDITLQFIIEAMVQTTIGGLLGMAVGLGLVFGLPVVWRLFGSNLPAQLDVGSIFLSLGVAVTVGVLFGWYPARRASRLDPIEALRHV